MEKKQITPRRKLLLIAALLALIVAILGAFVAYPYIQYYLLPNTAFSDSKRVVDLPRGTTFGELPSLFVQGGLLDNPEILAREIAKRGMADRLVSGRYTIARGMTTRAIVNMLVAGRQTAVRLVVPSVRTAPELAGRLARQIALDSATILATLRDPGVASRYDLTLEALPAMVIPNTYEVYWDITAQGLLDRLHREWEAFWGARRDARAEAIGLTRVEVSTLASIIQEEVMHADELARVAGVYMNRLRIGMPLQACPTAKFAAGNMALTRILHEHTQIASPYNTYLHRGLPPGPIRYPSIRAIDAVLGYERHDYLFFCAREDFSGYHHFSRTGLQHAEYARRYQRELNRRGIH